MEKKRVVVTGIGAVAAPGLDVDALWKGLISGPHGPGPHVIENWDPEPIIPKRESRRLDRFTGCSPRPGTAAARGGRRGRHGRTCR